MTYEFLSADWMVAVREIRERYRDHAPKVSVAARFNQVVTGVPFGDDTIHSHMDTSSGVVVMELGHLDGVDATLTTDYETARYIFLDQDPQRVMEALLTGKVKVEGDLLKVMSMHVAIPDNGVTQTMADEIRAITA